MASGTLRGPQTPAKELGRNLSRSDCVLFSSYKIELAPHGLVSCDVRLRFCLPPVVESHLLDWREL